MKNVGLLSLLLLNVSFLQAAELTYSGGAYPDFSEGSEHLDLINSSTCLKNGCRYSSDGYTKLIFEQPHLVDGCIGISRLKFADLAEDLDEKVIDSLDAVSFAQQQELVFITPEKYETLELLAAMQKWSYEKNGCKYSADGYTQLIFERPHAMSGWTFMSRLEFADLVEELNEEDIERFGAVSFASEQHIVYLSPAVYKDLKSQTVSGNSADLAWTVAGYSLCFVTVAGLIRFLTK